MNDLLHLPIDEFVKEYRLIIALCLLGGFLGGLLIITIVENVIYSIWVSWDFERIKKILAVQNRKLIEEKLWFKDARGNYHGYIYHISLSDYYILRKVNFGEINRSIYYLYENENYIKGSMHCSELCCLLKSIIWKDVRVTADTRGYDLTYGKEYLALDETDLCYEVEVDNGKKRLLFKNLFLRSG